MNEDELADKLEPLWPILRVKMLETVLRYAAEVGPEKGGYAAAVGQELIADLSKLSVTLPTVSLKTKAPRLNPHNPHANR